MPFRVRNSSRGDVVLGERIERAQSWHARLRGLMGCRSLGPGQGLHLVPCRAIHTFLMRFPIDVAFLDCEGTVVGATHSMAPWRVSRVFPGAHSALELPAGTLNRTGTLRGDRLKMEHWLECWGS